MNLILDLKNWHQKLKKAALRRLSIKQSYKVSKILWRCSFGCKSLLNFICLAMKFNNCHRGKQDSSYFPIKEARFLYATNMFIWLRTFIIKCWVFRLVKALGVLIWIRKEKLDDNRHTFIWCDAWVWAKLEKNFDTVSLF